LHKKIVYNVPGSLFIIIIAILAAMYYYAAYIDLPAPEKTLKNFYQAYFERDFDTVAENLSVLWSVRLLPQYASLKPAELIEKRDAIEKETSRTIAEIEAENKELSGITVEIMPSYTKEGENSALVVYSLKKNGKPISTEMAILVKESGQLRIYDITSVTNEDLEYIKDYDISELDRGLADLLAE